MFTHHIQNLEVHKAFIISEPEFTVCAIHQSCILDFLFLHQSFLEVVAKIVVGEGVVVVAIVVALVVLSRCFCSQWVANAKIKNKTFTYE